METKVAEEGDGVDLGEVGEQEDAGGRGELALWASYKAHRHPCRVDVVLLKQRDDVK